MGSRDFTTTLLAAATGSEPAGGAAIGQIVIASAGAMVLTALLLWLGMGHRNGKVQTLSRLGATTQRLTGLPPWSSFPAVLATISLVTAVFGMYWDISLHIDVGRDAGPLANPAHYFILLGLFGIFSAGFFAMVMPKDKPSAGALRITRDWYAPLGGVLIAACGAFSLTGFPLDDVWHRLFGQDVTLWGPTHLMLIGGATMTLIGIAVLVVEGVRSPEADPSRVLGYDSKVRWTMAFPLCGGLLIGLSTFQAEFDFGVGQFRFVFQPMLIMVAAGLGLVATRMFAGRGAALAAVAFFILVRGILTILVGPVLGESTVHFPLYIVEALIVELVALRWSRDRPLAFGLASGLGIGTVGLAAEWGWSHVWMPIPWPSDLLPEGAILGFAGAMAGSLLGAWIGHRLATEPAPGRVSLRRGALVGAVALTAMVAFALNKPADSGVQGRLALTPAGPGQVNATVRFSPRDAADHADWLTMTAWQGGHLQTDNLKRIGEGVYRTNEPVPVTGNWKSLVRLHVGNSLTAIPVYLPEDRGIPAKEVPARSGTRTFVSDHKILQREQKASGGLLTAVAYVVVAGISFALLALLAWGLHRLALGAGVGAARESRRRRSTTVGGPGDAQAPLAGTHA